MSLGLYSFCHNTCSATVTRFLLAKCYQAESDMKFPLLWLNVSALKPRHYQYFCSPSKWL